jgi:hypothetical protein
VLGALARDVRAALDRGGRQPGVLGPAAQDDLPEARHDRAGGAADAGAVGVDRQLAPGERLQALLGGDRVDRGAGLLGLGGVLRQEGRADRRTGPASGSSTPCSASTARRNASGTWVRMPAPSPVSGSLPEAPRCSRLRSAVRPCSTVSWRDAPGDVGQEGDAAGVVLVRRVVQALGVREGRSVHGKGLSPGDDVCGAHLRPGTTLALLQMSTRLQHQDLGPGLPDRPPDEPECPQ